MAAQKRILLEDWQEIKPYNKTAKSDLYFLGISNEINDKIYEKEFHIPLQNFIREEGISLFCMFLTSYLEDIISGSEVWNSFIKKHKELYGKPLPFYETDKNYVEGEVNIQDVKFLVWYFINTVNKNILLNPHDPFIQSISEGLVGILETEYEYAPENDLLRETYQIEPTQDYYEVRRLLNNILTKTYLFFPDTGFALLRQEAEIMEAGRRVEATLDDNRDRFIHEACTSLLALSAKEWAVLILGKKHPVAKDLEKMSPRVQGSFLFLGEDEKYLKIKHIATDKKFKLLKSSFPKHKDLKEKSIIFMGIVEWHKEWWFSGVSIMSDYNEDFIEKEKQNIHSKESLSFMEDQALIRENLKEHHEAFLIYNKGIPIVFLKKEEVDDFMNGYFDFFTETAGLSAEEKEKAVKKYKPKATKEEEKPDTVMVVFHNINSGFEVYSNIENAFCIKQNKFLNKDRIDQDFYQIFLANFYSKEILDYSIEVSEKKISFFKKNNYTKEELDFFTRFFKQGNYHTKPRLTVIKNA